MARSSPTARRRSGRPQSDKPEIASRLGWLSKEVGDQGAARRYFARARGDQGFSFTIAILAVTAIVSLSSTSPASPAPELGNLLMMNKPLLAQGELWRLWTVTLVHAPLERDAAAPPVQPVLPVDRGPVRRAAVRALAVPRVLPLFAAGASLMSFAFSPPRPARRRRVGRDLRAVRPAGRGRPHPPPDPRPPERGFLGQLTALVVINLFLGFILPDVDNMAHIGGLAHGPGLRPAVRAQPRPDDALALDAPGPDARDDGARSSGRAARSCIRVAGLALVAAGFAALWTIGDGVWG